MFQKHSYRTEADVKFIIEFFLADAGHVEKLLQDVHDEARRYL
jgi:hypothetical protein